MPAPRTLAPTSVGAPMRLTIFMERDCLSLLRGRGVGCYGLLRRAPPPVPLAQNEFTSNPHLPKETSCWR
jgi:hypothetical protein